VGERRVAASGDPFTAAQNPPHACYGGVVYIGHQVEDPDTGETVEEHTAYPCRKCAEEGD
jgi:hypothetical protein